jgi:hypothetical protein
MNNIRKVLIFVAISCALISQCSAIGGDILSPFFDAKTGLLNAAKTKVNGKFDLATNSLSGFGGSNSNSNSQSGGFNPLQIVHSLLQGFGGQSKSSSSSSSSANSISEVGSSSHSPAKSGGFDLGGILSSIT